jgi:hypothetical protein
MLQSCFLMGYENNCFLNRCVRKYCLVTDKQPSYSGGFPQTKKFAYCSHNFEYFPTYPLYKFITGKRQIPHNILTSVRIFFFFANSILKMSWKYLSFNQYKYTNEYWTYKYGFITHALKNFTFFRWWNPSRSTKYLLSLHREINVVIFWRSKHTVLLPCHNQDLMKSTLTEFCPASVQSVYENCTVSYKSVYNQVKQQ